MNLSTDGKSAEATAPLAESHDTREPMGTVSVSLALLTVVLWGGTAVANQFAIDVYPPLFVGGIRFGLAAIFMVGWCWISGTSMILRGVQWWISILLGALMFLQISTFNYGTAISNASHATVLVNSYVFWVAAYEAFIARTLHLRWYQTLGLFMAGAGVCVLVATSQGEEASGMDQVSLWGDLVLAASGLTLAVKIITVKWATKKVHPASLILWHDVFGTLLLFMFSGLLETHSGAKLTIEAVAALLFGGIVISGLCFVLNAQLLQKHGASQVSVFSFVTPLCGILLAYFFRGDRLSGWLIVSGILVAAGIFLVNYVSRPATAKFAESNDVA
ncbi:DMT family transporter [Planctomicrobium sp.]|nr:DMT family transporter [Planctomicrobium sp.]MDB4439500.1 DMT family transporter [Planctomicrobium sp.]